MTTIKVITCIINVYLLILAINKLKYGVSIFHFLILVSEFFFVIPIALDLIVGVPNFTNGTFYAFELSKSDFNTNLIYCTFIMVMNAVFYSQISKHCYCKNLREKLGAYISSIKINPLCILMLIVIMFSPIVVAILSPNPEYYFYEFAPFVMKDLQNTSAYTYNANVMMYSLILSMLAILILRIFNRSNIILNSLEAVMYCVDVLFSGKRTLGALVLVALMSIDILKKQELSTKFIIRKVSITVIFIATYFYIYVLLSGKTSGELNIYEYIRIYFGRDCETKLAIYSLLHPESVRILEYGFQSYLYNLTFFIPREMWNNKPLPYGVYLTSAMSGIWPARNLGWQMTTSYFGEAIANLGVWGFPFSIFSYVFIARQVERKNNMIVTLLSIIVLCALMGLQFSGMIPFVIIWITSLLFTRKHRKLKYKFVLKK